MLECVDLHCVNGMGRLQCIKRMGDYGVLRKWVDFSVKGMGRLSCIKGMGRLHYVLQLF